MILPDLNLLIFAYDRTSPFHAKGKSWWERCLSGTETIGLPWAVALGFVRIMTNRRIFENPMAVRDATRHVRAWLDIAHVQILHPGARHLDLVMDFLNELGAAGNMTTDAHIAALAKEYQAVIHSADVGFARFSGVRWLNPLQ